MAPAAHHATDARTDAQAEALRRELERLQVLASRDRGLLTTLLRHSPHGILVCDPRGRLVLQNSAAERIWRGSATTAEIADWASYRAFHPDGTPYRPGDWSMARALVRGEIVDAEEIAIERFDGSRAVILGSTAPIRDAEGTIQGAVSVFADITDFKERERALLARERGTADRLARLHAFTAALWEAQDLRDVARVTVEHGQAALSASAGLLFLAVPGEARLLHSTAGSEVQAALGRVPEDADLAVAHAVRSGEPAWIGSRAEHERRWPESARALSAHLPPAYAIAVLPLDVRAGRIGALVFTYEGERSFEAEDRALLLAMARQAAQALDRARLHDAERRARAEAEDAQRRTAFLSEASAVLVSSLDYEWTLAAVARLAVPRVCDWCSVDLVETYRDGPVAFAHADPAKVERARELRRRHPPDPDAPRGVPNVLRTGRPELYEEITDALLVAAARDEEHLRALRELGLRSAMVVPMAARGRVLGAMTFASAESGRRYAPADLEMAQHLARRSALAIDNARLYADAQQAIRARDDVLAIVSHDLRNPLHAIGMASNLLSKPTTPAARVRAHAAAIERSTRRMGRLIQDLLDSSRIETGRFTLDRQPAFAASMVGEAVALLAPIAADKGVRLVAEPAGALEVVCDRERVLQVLSNLVGNAVNFTPAGGAVTVSATAEGPLARFSVTDTGVGIPEEHQERIFDRYWRSRESRQGTGLGLTIAKGIVEAHGGRIWVESRPGEGATFHFTLPRSPSAGMVSTPTPVPLRGAR